MFHIALQTCCDLVPVLVTTPLYDARERDNKLRAITTQGCPPSSKHRHMVLTTHDVVNAKLMKWSFGRDTEDNMRKRKVRLQVL
jgi:hypothetical protein